MNVSCSRLQCLFVRFEELKKQSHADIMNVLDRDVIFTVNTPGRVAIPSIFTFWEQGQRRTGAYNFLSRRRLVQLICSVTARKLSLFLASEKIEYILMRHRCGTSLLSLLYPCRVIFFYFPGCDSCSRRNEFTDPPFTYKSPCGYFRAPHQRAALGHLSISVHSQLDRY